MSNRPERRPSKIGELAARAGRIGSTHANGGVQPGELGVVGKRQVQMDGLQVGPAVPAAIEDAVERLVDEAVIVRPNHHLAVRVHPGMHGGGQQPGPERLEEGIDAADAGVELGGKRGQRAGRLGRLQLDDVGRQLVRPGDLADLDVGDDLAGDGLEHSIGDRPHVERPGVDDHVLQLDAERFKEVQRSLRS